jgi:hypothetical protein
MKKETPKFTAPFLMFIGQFGKIGSNLNHSEVIPPG